MPSISPDRGTNGLLPGSGNWIIPKPETIDESVLPIEPQPFLESTDVVPHPRQLPQHRFLVLDSGLKLAPFRSQAKSIDQTTLGSPIDWASKQDQVPCWPGFCLMEPGKPFASMRVASKPLQRQGAARLALHRVTSCITSSP